MIRTAITLPLRIGARATRMGLRIAEQAVAVALRAAEQLIGASVPAESPPAADRGEPSGDLRLDVVIVAPRYDADTPSTAAPAETASRTAPSPPRSPEAPVAPQARTAPELQKPPETAPAHVSEELQFVEAFAEPGAEGGAGAAVRVDEPWNGYAQMTASEVIAQLSDATPEALTAVSLYERAHRRRETVVTAAEQRLRRANAAAREHQPE